MGRDGWARWLATGVVAWLGLALGVGRAGAQAEGTLRWAQPFQTGGAIEFSPAMAADGSAVYLAVNFYNPDGVTGSGKIFAIDTSAANKGELWSVKFNDLLTASPVVGADGTIYVSCYDSYLYALRSDSSQKWAYFVNGPAFGSPAIGDGVIYVADYGFLLHAVYLTDGTRKWLYSSGPNGGFLSASPAVAPDGTIYFSTWASAPAQDTFVALNPDMSVKWKVQTPAEIVESSPAIGADGTIFAGAYDGNLYAFSPADGAIKWTGQTTGNGYIAASPVIGQNGTIYVGSSDKQLYAFDVGNTPVAAPRWVLGTNGAVNDAATVRADGVVIFGSGDGVVRAITPAKVDAQLPPFAWAPISLKRSLVGAPLVGPDGTIYVTTITGNLYAINGNGSPPSAYSSWPTFGGNSFHTSVSPIPPAGGQLINLSTRASAGGGPQLIMGMALTGSAPQSLLIRGVGPTLSGHGVAAPLIDPTLSLYRSSATTPFATNDNWDSGADAPAIEAAATAVGAFALPWGSKDSALLTTLSAGLYSAVIGSKSGDTGVALVEAYQASVGASGKLINLSTRGFVGTGENALIPGLVVGGSAPLRLLIRAVGPALTPFGVDGVLARPQMVIQDAGGKVRATNSGWTASGTKADLAAAFAALGAFPFADGSTDCAALVTLEPGAYSVIVTGAGASTGEALVEVYLVH